MANKIKERNSSIELLRIFAIFIIILNHYALYSGFDVSEGINLSNILPTWLHIGGKLGVNIFVFISSYFLCKGNKFKLEKLLKLFLEVLFYSIIILVIGTCINNMNLKYAVKLIFAIPSGCWQYITIYVMLYILSPYINIMLEHIELKSLLKLVAILTITYVIFPSFTSFGFDITYSIAWFMYIYILAAFVRRIEDNIPKKPKLYLLIAFLSIGIIALSELVIKYISINYVNQLSNWIEHFRNYNSIFVIISTVFLFLGFKQVQIKSSKIINNLASTSLAVFILHDNDVIRDILWKNILKSAEFQESSLLIVHAIGSCLTIFIVFATIDLLRQRLIEKHVMNYLKPKIENIEYKINKKIDNISKENMEN